MKKLYMTGIFAFFSLLLSIYNTAAASAPMGCAVAGTADATQDSICDNGNTFLTLTGYIGNIQWQSYNGTAWVNETGPGANADTFNVAPLVTTDYRAYVTDIGCPDDSSNVITITVGVPSPIGTGASRCGYGPITLTGSGGSNLKWYDVPTGGSPLGTGSSYSPTVFGTTTYYLASSSSSGGSGVTPMPPENTTFSSNARGYWFTAPSDFNITGLFVPNPANGATQNIAVIRFTPAVPPPFYATVTNAFTTLFLTQNDPSVGVIPVYIPIYAGDVIGVLATRGTGDVNSYGTSPSTTTINGQTVTISRMGMQFPLSTQLPHDIWQEAGGSVSRLEITYETGCESVRVPVVATVVPADSVSINAGASALCLGNSTTLTAVSTNANYTYTWSPSTGLSATTGTSVTANPSSTITYALIGDDGTCADVDSITIDVGPTSVAGTAFTVSDTVCLGNTTIMTLTGSTGNIQWQSNDGTGWVNETNPGFDSTVYSFNPILTKTYRAYVVSGGCPPDSSNILSITVITINAPTTVDSSRCGPGIVLLSAAGNGTLNWYTDSVGGTLVNSGTTYNANVTNTTTFWVDNSAGGIMHVGPPNASMGSQSYATSNDYGIQFDVSQTITIEKVYVYPGAAGTVTVNLRQTQGGPILNTATLAVQFAGITAVPLNFQVNPGTNYRLEIGSGSPTCEYNTTGATWPYTGLGVPVTLTANLNPNPSTGGQFYYFYDWEITTGCKSIRVPVTATVDSMPATPVISANGNVLTSSSPTANQWYFNGNILPGETNQNLTALQPGSYTVTVTYNGCTAVSSPFVIASAEEIENELSWNIFPNPGREVLNIHVNARGGKEIEIRILDIPGKLVYGSLMDGQDGQNQRIDLSAIAAGVYVVELNVDGIKRYKKLIIDK